MINTTFSYVIKGGTHYNSTCKAETSLVFIALYVLMKCMSGDGGVAESCTEIM
jgi:hypothetical protein